jgi:hypothetical protein
MYIVVLEEDAPPHGRKTGPERMLATPARDLARQETVLMPDQEKCTPKSTPPAYSIAQAEAEAHDHLRRAHELLWFVRFFLDYAYDRLTDPADAEAMGTGEIPESLSFSLRGAIECAHGDYVHPLDELLRKAIAETPESLVRDWRKRQKKQERERKPRS